MLDFIGLGFEHNSQEVMMQLNGPLVRLELEYCVQF